MSSKTYTATVHKDSGLYVAQCFEIGTVSKGATVEQALNNLKTTTEEYLHEFSEAEIAPVAFKAFVREVAG